jgi:hypothetical protein
MAEQSQRTDVTNGQGAEYMRAGEVETVLISDTTTFKPDIRIVVTRATQGTLELRYTPREPSPITGKTSP